ncbi:DUF2958 domain-containing protein [Acidiphilium acidophilum]|uniref:DUF2958 domain-containing protein n=1 Tax=Acidiphilium acidophilum TaxID=76588 RepID=UPI002E8E66B6|nr:DUF2958 domain-containing protein [Acidiphilium acidophilum]
MLITDEQRATMLANGHSYATNLAFDPHPVVKLFDPLGGGTWLLTDLDPADEDIAGGICDLGMGFPEIGTGRLSELQDVVKIAGRWGVGIERDKFFVATKPLSEYAELARTHRRIVLK